jgi:hypothetical protein
MTPVVVGVSQLSRAARSLSRRACGGSCGRDLVAAAARDADHIAETERRGLLTAQRDDGQWPSHRANGESEHSGETSDVMFGAQNQSSRTTSADGPRSPNPEVQHDGDEDIYRGACQTSRLESPLGNGRYCFFIETAAIQRPDDTDLRHAAVP